MSASKARSVTQVAGDSLQPIGIQILHIRDCRLLQGLRELVARCVTQSALSVTVEEIEGPYPSPTLFVNGKDPTGRPIAGAPSCRLDLPAGEQILAALAQAHAPTSTLHLGDGPDGHCA